MKYFMQKLIVENFASIDKKRCLYQRNQAEPCRICQDNCPSKAISSTKTCMVVDEDACQGCGICRSTCPSQAITLKEFGELKNLQNLNQLDVIVVGCKQEGSAGNVVFPCIHGLTKEYLASLMLVLKEKGIYFNLSQCENCYIEKGCHYLNRELAKAETFVNGVGINSSISLIYNKEDLPNFTTQIMSRRQLLALLKEESVHITVDATNSILGKSNVKDFQARNLLLDLLKEEENVREEELHVGQSIFTSWKIESKCNGCGMCEAICPWKAWQIDGLDEINLSHDARRCRSCNLCRELCPQQAIIQDDFSLSLLDKPKVKATVHQSRCQKCNKKYVPQNSDQQLCSTCSKREKLKKSAI